MGRSINHLFAGALAVVPLSFTFSQAMAQAYPTKPVRIYTSAPAGPYDIVLRGISPTLQQALGQPIVIENKTGANYVPPGRDLRQINTRRP